MKKDLVDSLITLTSTDPKSLSQKALKLVEEVGELAKAVLPYEDAAGTTHRFVDRSKIIEEVCDSVIVALSVAYSIGATEEDLEDMFQAKIMKWAEIQKKERRSEWPVPFEIHVTVSTSDLGKFKDVCSMLGVKPIVLDLQDQEGASITHDVMTSSVHTGTNSTAYNELERIVEGLQGQGLEVVRKKIETVPWHPAAPSADDADPTIPKDCYFECHLGIRVGEDRLEGLRAVCSNMGLHLSKNILKRREEGDVIIMATHRLYEGTREMFDAEAKSKVSGLERLGYRVDKLITEFSIYDSKVGHDSSWIRNMES